MRWFVLIIAAALAAGCYHVALAPEARARIETVRVVVGVAPVGFVPTDLDIREPIIRDERWSVPDCVRRALTRQLVELGWDAEAAPETVRFSTGGLLQDPWPADLCELGDTVLWAVPYMTWRPDVASAVGEIDLVANLVACPEGDLLWRDRIIRNVTLYYRAGRRPAETPGTDEVDLRVEEAERVIDDMVAELLASL